MRQKFSRLKKVSVKTWLVSSLFVFLTVGLLVALYASRLTTEDRSGATGGAPELFFSPATAVLTQDDQQHLQPVQNIEVHVTSGRPIASYSFVMKLTDAAGQPATASEWSKLVFTPNGKLAENASDFIGSGDRPTAKLFVGTIGQKADGITRFQDTVNSGKLGSFTFTPSQTGQQDLRLSFYTVPGKSEANSLYVLGSLLSPPVTNGEVQIPQENFANVFNLHNPFLVSLTPSPTPVVNDVSPARLQYATVNGGTWQNVGVIFDGYNVGGTLKTYINVADIDQAWRTSSLAPAFRLRVKQANGTYRQTTVDGQTTDVLIQSEANGTFAGGTFWSNWKVAGSATSMFLTVPGTTNQLQIARGDIIEITVNLKRVESGVVYNCTVNNELVVYPLGQPGQQQVLGPCRNNSKAELIFATPVPTDTPAPPPGDTVRLTVNYTVSTEYTDYFNAFCRQGGSYSLSGLRIALTDLPTSCIVSSQPKQLSCLNPVDFGYVSSVAGLSGTAQIDVLRSCIGQRTAISLNVIACEDTDIEFSRNLSNTFTVSGDRTFNMTLRPDIATVINCHGPALTPTPTAIP